MDFSARRLPRRNGGRRVTLNVTVSRETKRDLAKIGRGNRSRAIEELVAAHLERQRPILETMT
jgi:hypothetical protein